MRHAGTRPECLTPKKTKKMNYLNLTWDPDYVQTHLKRILSES